jgi:DNA-binding phage protein
MGPDSEKRIHVAFYRTAAGNLPVREWLKDLDPEDRKIVGDDLRTVELGWPLGMPLCRSLSSHKGLWEVRSALPGNRAARVLSGRRPHGVAARVRQENPKDARRRSPIGGQTHEGDAAMTDNPHIGSSLEEFLEEEGRLEEATATAVKRVLAWQIAERMKREHITKAEMARRMRTSRSQLDRLLDPEKTTVQLNTLLEAAKALGRQLRVELR